MPIFKIIVVLKIMQNTKNFTVRISYDVLIFQADLTMTRSGKTLEAGPEKKEETFYGSRNSPQPIFSVWRKVQLYKLGPAFYILRRLGFGYPRDI